MSPALHSWELGVECIADRSLGWGGTTLFCMPEITWSQFEAVEMRAGTIVTVDEFPQARKPAYIITVDFGAEIGVRRTSAQVKTIYGRDELVGRQVMGVLNFPPKQIGRVMSEFLLVGFYREDGAVVLAVPERPVQNGARVG